MASFCDVKKKSKHHGILDLLSTCQTFEEKAALDKAMEGKRD